MGSWETSALLKILLVALSGVTAAGWGLLLLIVRDTQRWCRSLQRQVQDLQGEVAGLKALAEPRGSKESRA